jgi:hypothetical protein
MKKRFACVAAALLLSSACGGSESAPGTGGGGSGGTGTAPAEIRGERYCEILAAFVEGSNVRIDVYNTFGLNDCPEAAWSAVDPSKVQAQLGASSIRMNGPRRWIIDRFTNSAWLDPTQVELGGLAMRKAGQLVLPLSEATTAGSAYVTHTIERNTTYVFDAGKDVFELHDPMGRVFVMQSFSLEHEALTEADLPGLAAKITLPSGWTFQARTLTEALEVTAVDGTATVVQDDLADTYQLAQP